MSSVMAPVAATTTMALRRDRIRHARSPSARRTTCVALAPRRRGAARRVDANLRSRRCGCDAVDGMTQEHQDGGRSWLRRRLSGRLAPRRRDAARPFEAAPRSRRRRSKKDAGTPSLVGANCGSRRLLRRRARRSAPRWRGVTRLVDAASRSHDRRRRPEARRAEVRRCVDANGGSRRL